MSIRTFIFCDICNPQGLRSIEYRRIPREKERSGRRLSDGRAWFEGPWSDAIKDGWNSSPEYPHICPACQNVIAK